MGKRAAFIAGLLLLVSGASTWGQEVGQDELQSVFQRLLENPSDAALNFRYAQLAIEQNRLRNALAAYERILAADPNDERAKAGIRRITELLKPEFTALTLTLGGQYETNPQLSPNARQAGDDWSVQPSAELVDERLVGGVRMRSEAEFYSSFYGTFSELNSGRVAANTGPSLGLGDWSVRPGIGAGYAWLDGATFYSEAAFLLNFSPAPGTSLRRINTRFAYNWINPDVAQRDAFTFEIAPLWVWVGQMMEQDTVIVSPLYRFNGVNGGGPIGTGLRGEPFPLQSHQIGGRLDYYIAVLQDLAIDINFTAYYQPYNQADSEGTGDRRDFYFAPGIQLIVKEALFKQHDLVLGYLWEENRSNDAEHSFTDHTISLRSVWRF